MTSDLASRLRTHARHLRQRIVTNIPHEDLDQAATRLSEQEAEIERLRSIGLTLSDTLRMYGYPVSEAHWRNASGSMSAEARALHLAAESFRAALSALAEGPDHDR